MNVSYAKQLLITLSWHCLRFSKSKRVWSRKISKGPRPNHLTFQVLASRLILRCPFRCFCPRRLMKLPAPLNYGVATNVFRLFSKKRNLANMQVQILKALAFASIYQLLPVGNRTMCPLHRGEVKWFKNVG